MNNILLKNKIVDFWKWFETHEEKFRKIENPDDTRELMDNQILQFGLFAWEIGEGKKKPHTFTMSPNGSMKMLRISEAIMGEAPNLKDWEFYPARPAREWDFTFEMYDSFMMKRTIDAAEWEYILRMTPEMKVRILLYSENIDFLDAEDKMGAADFVLNSIIGEADRIHYVEEVVFIPLVTETQEEDIQPLKELQYDFEDLLEEYF